MNSADAQSADSIRLALATRLLDAMRYDTQLARMTSPPTAGTESNADVVRAHREFQLKYITPDKLRPVLARGLVDLYSQEELQQLVDFYESPLGRKWTESQPKMSAMIGPVIAEIYQAHGAELLEILTKGVKPPQP